MIGLSKVATPCVTSNIILAFAGIYISIIGKWLTICKVFIKPHIRVIDPTSKVPAKVLGVSNPIAVPVFFAVSSIVTTAAL